MPRRKSLFFAAMLSSAIAALAATTPPTFAPVPTTQPIPQVADLPPAPLAPASIDDLQKIQARVEAVTQAALPATVAVFIPHGEGSGVIISPDGCVLTAGHMVNAAGERIMIILSTGRRVSAVTLGADHDTDTALLKIRGKGPYPFVEIGKSTTLATGQWVVALGNPGGYRRDRPAVARLGRVTATAPRIITDCACYNGDSGGPLFDLDGRLVGIHSQLINGAIGPTAMMNVDAPIEAYINNWPRLLAGDQWGTKIAPMIPTPIPTRPTTRPTPHGSGN